MDHKKQEISPSYACTALTSAAVSELHLTAIERYTSYLKSFYTKMTLPRSDKWPFIQSMKYINLVLIEKDDLKREEVDEFTRAVVHGNISLIARKRKPITFKQIACQGDGTRPKCILIEGAPGIGKSTFAWKMCRKWGKGKILEQYKLVVWLRLRDLRVRQAEKLMHLFYHPDLRVQEEITKEIISIRGRGVLLLLEGYDELPAKMRAKASLFIDIITGKELPEATVLILTRPSATKFLLTRYRSDVSQYIEILGFTQEDIQSYLQSVTKDNPSLLDELQNYLSCYPHIRKMMYTPQNCAIVAEVYLENRKENQIIPRTKTEVYSSLVRSLLLRYLYEHPEHGSKSWNLRNICDALPVDVHQKLCELGRVAYEGILQDQQVIFSNLPDTFETFSLMDCSPELYLDKGASVSYNFLHITLQEYMAAFYLSQQQVWQQLDHFRSYGDDYHQFYKHFRPVLQFLAGLSLQKLSRCVPNQVRSLLSWSDKETGMDSYSTNDDLHISVDALHWIFEAHNSVLTKNLLSSDQSVVVNRQFIDTSHPSDVNFNTFVLGYCIAHSDSAWKINFTDCGIGDELVKMFVHGIMEAKSNSNGHILSLQLADNCITSTGALQLFSIPTNLISKTEELDLSGIDLDEETCEAFAHSISVMHHLKVLCLDSIPIGSDNAYMIKSLFALKYLQTLSLSRTGIGVEDCEALSKLMSSSQFLEELYIGYGNAIIPAAVEHIIIGLSNCSTLKVLDMSRTSISDKNCSSLASVLKVHNSLERLFLWECNIDADGAYQLAQALIINIKLEILNLNGNPIEIRGASDFAEMLLHNRSLVGLHLSDDSVGVDGTVKIMEALLHNRTLERLELLDEYQYDHSVKACEAYDMVKSRILGWDTDDQSMAEAYYMQDMQTTEL